MKKNCILCFMAVCMCAILGCKGNMNDFKESSAMVSVTTQTSSGEGSISETSEKKEPVIADEERGKGQIIDIYGEGDAERLGVGKTLIWVVPNHMDSCPTESAARKLNELLVNKYNCDFVVEFHIYDSLMSLKTPYYNHYDMLLDMKALGHQADILYSGNSNEYRDLVDAGIYEPLTGYFSTEDGQKLYNAYAEEIWKQTECNGESYGYISKTYPTARAALMCNTELAEEYEIEPGDSWSIYDVGNMLEGVQFTKRDKFSDTVIPLACDSLSLLYLLGYYEEYTISEYILFREDTEYGWRAVNPATDEGLIRLWKTIKEYYDKGWYINVDGNDFNILSRMGRFIFNVRYFNDSSLMENKLLLSDKSVCDVHIGDISYVANRLADNIVVGVASWSKNKEDALKLITIVQTSGELSNLLRFGVQGEDYDYRDGILAALPGKRNISTPVPFADISNINLTYSVYLEPEDKLAYSKEISANHADGVGILYDIDISSYSDRLGRIGQVYNKYNRILFAGNCEDVDAAVVAMKAEYREAGLDDVINDINRQIKEQNKNG